MIQKKVDKIETKKMLTKIQCKFFTHVEWDTSKLKWDKRNGRNNNADKMTQKEMKKKIKHIHLIWVATLKSKRSARHGLKKWGWAYRWSIYNWVACVRRENNWNVSEFLPNITEAFDILLQWMYLIRKSNKTIFSSSAYSKQNFSICFCV